MGITTYAIAYIYQFDLDRICNKSQESCNMTSAKAQKSLAQEILLGPYSFILQEVVQIIIGRVEIGKCINTCQRNNAERFFINRRHK